MFPQVNAILEFFLKNPTAKQHIREIARQTKFSPAGALKSLKKLQKEGIIIQTKNRAITVYKANTASLEWLPLKRIYNLQSLYDCGLIQSLKGSYNEPEAIVLFGSYAKGEDTEQSDIDIAIITKENITIDLKPFESKLSRKINILEVDLQSSKKEFLNTLANGIVLEGYLTLP